MAGTRLTPLEMLAELVAFDTESTKSNLALIDFVEDYLKAWGVSAVRLPNAEGDKAALFATIGPVADGGVVLSGHTDVVPVAGQNWVTDPYRLHVADGRAYGRGAVDMKGFVALALAHVPDFLAADLRKPIHLFLSYDEELTCLGVVDGIRRFGIDLPRPEIAIVGEPTDLTIVDAHKSVVTFTTTVHGREAHSAKPALGASAVMAGGLLVAELDRLSEVYAAKGDASARFDPPCTTVHVGTVAGGTARNIMAKECVINWEFRGLPDLDEDEIPQHFARYGEDVVLARMRRTAPEAAIATICHAAVPGLRPWPGSPAEDLVKAITGRNGTTTVAFATEAGHFQNAGVATVVCGPGSIDRAHQANEFITLAELEAGSEFLRRLTARLVR
jgi:acetylornithine deacetylase